MINLKYIKIKDVCIVLLILSVTFGYHLVEYIPDGISRIKFLSIQIDDFGFKDVKELFQFSRMKLLIIFLTIIWYMTCQHWWKSAILVITTIELLKLISAFNSEQNFIDEIEYIKSLPITIPIIIGIVIISNKLRHYNLANNVRLNIDNKIDEVFFELNIRNNEELSSFKERFLKLKESNKDKTKRDYVKDLISLRNEFYKN